MAEHLTHPYNRGQGLTIDGLSDDVLLKIFDLYVVKYQDLDPRQLDRYDYNPHIKKKIESWRLLLCVCRRWRGLVFGSPRHLNLQLFYGTAWMPNMPWVTDTSPVLGLLPLVVIFGIAIPQSETGQRSMDDTIALLEHRDRISQIDLVCCETPPSFWTAMTVQFLELIGVNLEFQGGPLNHGPLLPDSFLGGCAPRLRNLYLHKIPFPGLPKFTLSAPCLVNLHLTGIPHSGNISPEVMVNCLSMLTKLEEFQLEFYSPECLPDPQNRHPFSTPRSILPALMKVWFQGTVEYFDDFVARINTPQLYRLSTMLYKHGWKFPELHEFISRTPTLGEYDEAYLIFNKREAIVRLCQSCHEPPGHRKIDIVISCQDPDRQVSLLRQICTSSLRSLLTMENLYIVGDRYSPLINDGWLEVSLFRPFITIKNLYLSSKIPQHVAEALQKLAVERTEGILPALKMIFLEEFEPWWEERELTSRPGPVKFSAWQRRWPYNKSYKFFE